MYYIVETFQARTKCDVVVEGDENAANGFNYPSEAGKETINVGETTNGHGDLVLSVTLSFEQSHSEISTVTSPLLTHGMPCANSSSLPVQSCSRKLEDLNDGIDNMVPQIIKSCAAYLRECDSNAFPTLECPPFQCRKCFGHGKEFKKVSTVLQRVPDFDDSRTKRI